MRKFTSGPTGLLALSLSLAGTQIPAMAQEAGADARLRRLEAEVRELKRQAGTDRTVAPQTIPAPAAPRMVGAPASSPVTDLLARVDALEAQLARLTAQNEEGGNKLRQLEERIAANEARSAAPTAAESTPASANAGLPESVTATNTANASNLAAMGGSAAVTRPASPTKTPTAATPSKAPPPRQAPSAQRVAAVRSVVKPQTNDAGDDEYSYGFRLWEAKLFPEAQQQLKLFLDKYPRHQRVSYARNLMGRALLDDGKPREAASWFLQNYKDNKRGERAPDSLLFLAEAMSQLRDSSRACIALAEFTDTYPEEAAGRLKSQYEATRASVKCN